ncbi:amphiregulin [Anomaloglossus baeobatrachus]|uniref:amphiregulin n=1 Tax=Anomaloglossus baeobatrachus TaxID=238106 RepID=UPI003F5097A8
MAAQLSLVWSILLLCLACKFTVRCSELNSTENEVRVTLSRAGDSVSARLQNAHEADYDEYHEDEDLSGYYVDDSIRVQAVVKPANGEVPATKVEKKKADKKKAEKNKNKKKKKTPCQTTHKNFCVHGKCRYLANISEVSCKCHENFFGERCTEQYLRAGTTDPHEMTTTTILAVVAVLLSTISITAIIIIIVIHTRRKYSSYDCEAEETKKLGQENGSEDV